MSKIISFLKSKKGDVIEAILVIPIFIVMLIFLGYQMEFHDTRNAVEDANRVITRYIMTSENMDDAVSYVNNYLKKRDDSLYFRIDENDEENFFTVENIIRIHVKDTGEIIEDKELMEEYWVQGNMVEFTFSRKTSYYDVTFNEFCPINPKTFNGVRTCFKLFQDTIVSNNIVVLEGVSS